MANGTHDTHKEQMLFQVDNGRKPQKVLTITFNTKPTLLSIRDHICLSKNPTELPVNLMRDNKKSTEHNVMAKMKI